MKNTTTYMIRRKSDGLFSTGGSYPKFTATGKMWRRIGDLHSHLNLSRIANYYVDCEIVTCSLQVDGVHADDVRTYLAQRHADKQKQQEAERLAANEANKRRQIEQAKELLRSVGEL